jgi:uncharacterized protein YceK
MRAAGLIILCLLLAGCASPRRREADAEARGYERGYAQAVKEQYWIIQNQQRRPAETAQSQQP